MGLSNRQYDMIMRGFDARRMQSSFELDRHREEIYEKIPEIKEIDDRIVTESIKRAKRALRGDRSAIRGLNEDNAVLSGKKEELLVQHGYPADYLKQKYSCNLCRDTGFIGNNRCDCFKKALTELIYNDSNLSEILAEQNFDNFDLSLYSSAEEDADRITGATPRENIEGVVSTARAFIENFDNSFENLLIYGNTGVGKTFLCSCIAKELLDTSHTVVYYTAYKFFKYLEDEKFHTADPDEDYPQSSSFLFDCDLLIIDDLGTELTNSFTNSALYSVINERSLRKHSTVISTNLSMADFAYRYSERIFSRINKDYTFLRIIGKDIRCL